jgi:hypothetical protein
VLGFLLVYNAGQIALRIWAFNLGLRDPDGIGMRISRSAIAGIQRRLMTAGVFLIGLVLPLLLAGVEVRGGGAALERPLLVFWWIAGGVGAIVGVRLGGRVRDALVILLAAFTLVGLIFGLSQ